MYFSSLCCSLASFVFVSSLGAAAFAQKPADKVAYATTLPGVRTDTHDGDQFYLMDADELNGDIGSPYGDLLKLRPPPQRALLIRPRVNLPRSRGQYDYATKRLV